jgi:hypothetical protein
MKLRNHQFSTQPRIFEGGGYEHPWYKHVKKELKSPNPPSKEAIEKAKFVDKTYQWTGRDNRIRPGNKRSHK